MGGISEFQRGGGYKEWNSEDMGAGSLDWNSKGMGGGGHGGTGIFQFGVVNSLISELIRNDSSKDDDLLVNMRHTQLKQHAGSTFQWSWSLEFLC